MEWLRSYRPDLVERYEELYARGAYVPRASRSGSAGSSGARARGADPAVGAVRREPAVTRPPDARGRIAALERPRGRPEPEQPKLF